MPDKIRIIEEKEKEKCNSCTVITLSKDVYKPNYQVVNAQKSIIYEKILYITSFTYNYNSVFGNCVSDINKEE